MEEDLFEFVSMCSEQKKKIWKCLASEPKIKIILYTEDSSQLCCGELQSLGFPALDI
tara:strand:+ start:310 stop:480 length:171 start_codon:yes stop_codon:yes gene_type:complete